MKLRDIAHSRAGDKGNISNISVIAFKEADFSYLLEHVTAERVADHFKDIVRGGVTRYELPKLAALNFVLQDALWDGVTRSLALDAHGKGLSSAMLNLDLPDKDEHQQAGRSSK